MPKKSEITSLFTTSKDVETLSNELAGIQMHPIFKLCSAGMKMLCSIVNDFNEVGKFLVKSEFYTHNALGSKPLKVVIRGLPVYSPHKILAELISVNLKLAKVFPFGRKGPGSYRDKLYLVHLEKDSIGRFGKLSFTSLLNGRVTAAEK